MTASGDILIPVCVCGEQRDRQVCMEYIASVLAGEREFIFREDRNAGRTPSAVFPIVTGEPTLRLIRQRIAS